MKTTLETTTIWLTDAEKTHFCGKSLASTLYELPITILLSGEFGAGKTTFLNGFSESLGIVESLTSPTFALENHYKTTNNVPFAHSDLYRLENPEEAATFLREADENKGIRCIEWAQRLESELKEPHIAVSLEDPHSREGREISVTFADIPLPSEEDIALWQKEMELPLHIVAHCKAVAELAEKLGMHLTTQGHIVRLAALKRAGLVHDLLRFVDFLPGAAHVEEKSEEPAVWQDMKKKYEGMRHEPACAKFLQEKGYGALAQIVEVHGLRLPPHSRRTVEQKLLYYADKRVKLDTVVSLDERFTDFQERYGSSDERVKEGSIWYKEAHALEQELFHGTPPY